MWSSSFLTVDQAGELQGYWSPYEAMLPILGVLLLYAILMVALTVLAGYIVNRWKGAAITLLLLSLPGLCALFGDFFPIGITPIEYDVGGTGALGSAWGMTPLILLGMLTGWSFVLIISDAFQLQDKFRHLYDHAWYSAAVLAGVFFVADLDAARTTNKLQRVNETARQASAFLLQQVRDYDAFCRRAGASDRASCTWASNVQQTLNHYASEDERVFGRVGPKSPADVYGPIQSRITAEEILVIRRELREFNESICPTKSIGNGISQLRITSNCQMPPPSFCAAYPEPLDGESGRDTPLRSVAIATECIVPSLVVWQLRHDKLRAIVEEHERGRHWRWLFYILFSIAAGGKIANSTARVIGIGSQPENERKRSIRLVRSVGASLASFSRRLTAICLQLVRTLVSLVVTRRKRDQDV